MPCRRSAAGDAAAGRDRHPALRAEVGQAAARAAGPTGEADGAAVIDELMAEDDPLAPGDDRDEVTLGTDCVGAAREVEAPADPADVGVDDDPLGAAKPDAEDDVGRLPADARQLHQFGERRGNLAAMSLNEPLTAAEEVLRLRAEESGAADHLLDVLLSRGCQASGGRPAAEQLRGHLIDAAIGALGREDGRQKELEWRAEIERTAGGGVEI